MPRHETPGTRTGPQDSAGPVRPHPHQSWAHEVRGGPSLRWDGLSSSPQEPLTLQPEAMLLWLTLTLLWCPTCWVHHKSSWGSPPPILLEAPLTPPLCPGQSGPALVTDRLLSGLSPRLEGLCPPLGRNSQHVTVCLFFPLPHLVLSYNRDIRAWRRYLFQYL